jgi:hypothetical protein
MIGRPVVPEHLYWTDTNTGSQDSGTITEANLDGTHPQLTVSGQIFPFGIALDRRHVYWTVLEDNNRDAGDGSIWEANLDGGNPHAILTGIDEPAGLAVLVPVSRR